MNSSFQPVPADLTGYTPTEEDLASLRDWFDAYDTAAAAGEVTAMADLADFPLNLVTDTSAGNAWTAQTDRAGYERDMAEPVPPGTDTSFESTRTPFFLSPTIAVVFSDSVMTRDGDTHRLRYADILVKKDGRWAFQTMIQPGWGDYVDQSTN